MASGRGLLPLLVALPALPLPLLFLRPVSGQNEVARDISFQLAGSYLTPAGTRAHLVATAQGPTAAPIATGRPGWHAQLSQYRRTGSRQRACLCGRSGGRGGGTSEVL